MPSEFEYTFDPTEAERAVRDRLAAEETEAARVRDAEDLELSASWTPMDLTEALKRTKEPPPVLLERDDGQHLLYAGRMHWFLGEPEGMKSWLALLAAAQTLARGENVLYVDYEDNDRSVVGRLLDMGVDPEAVRAHFNYLRPRTRIGDGQKRVTPAQGVLLETLRMAEWALVVLDGVTESLALEGLDPNDNAEVAEWLRRLPRRMTQWTNAAVVCVDHVTKAVEGRGRYAIGAQHKLASVDGVSLMIEVITPLTRANGVPVTGRSRLIVGKDRPGFVRGVSDEGKFFGTFEVTSFPDGTLQARIASKVLGATVPLDAVEGVLDVLLQYGGDQSETQVEKHSQLSEGELVEALKWLRERGWVESYVKSNANRVQLLQKGRDEMDEVLAELKGAG